MLGAAQHCTSHRCRLMCLSIHVQRMVVGFLGRLHLCAPPGEHDDRLECELEEMVHKSWPKEKSFACKPGQFHVERKANRVILCQQSFPAYGTTGKRSEQQDQHKSGI